MDGLRDFVKPTIIGGLGVLLPILVLFIVFNALFRFITNSIRPITGIFTGGATGGGFLADIISILIIVAISFVLGVAVRTRLGSLYHNLLEKRIFAKIPGYSLVKDTMKYFSGGETIPFSSVAMVKPFDNETLVPVFITDKHPDGSYTVFAPQGPIPTQGAIYTVPGSHTFVLDVGPEAAMKAIIGAGAGTETLLAKYREQYL